MVLIFHWYLTTVVHTRQCPTQSVGNGDGTLNINMKTALDKASQAMLVQEQSSNNVIN